MTYLQSENGIYEQMPDQLPYKNTSPTPCVSSLLLCLQSLMHYYRRFQAHHPQTVTAATAFKKYLQFLSVPFLLITFSASYGVAQNQDTLRVQVEQDLERALEEADPEDAESTIEELVDFVENLANNPLNINRASLDELVLVPGLNLRLAQSIVEYRASNAPFASVEDLVKVRGIGPATLGRIRPYLSAGTRRERGRDLYLNPRFWTDNSRFEMFSRYQQTLQKQNGYLRDDGCGYMGSPGRYYQRIRYRSNHLSLNLTQEKDPGEPLSGLAGFDYNSRHFVVEDAGNLQMLVVGDYSLAFGQGLIMWSGGSFGKGQDVVRSISKNDRGVRPFTSAQEATGFRGVAATYGNRFQVTGFYSNRKRTAVVVDEGVVNFPTQTGYHRTANEIARKNNLGQETFGGRLRAELPFGFIGFSGYMNRFDQTIAQGTQPYQRYRFTGRDLTALSADLRILLGSVILFSEAGYTDNGGYGVLTGAEIEIGENSDAALAYRYYDKAFHSIFGSAFGEQTGITGNEEGFYIGIRHRLSSSLRLSGYLDQFRFPAPRFQTHQPTSGFDWLALLEYQPRRDLSLYFLARYKVRGEEYNSEDMYGREIRLLSDATRSSYRLHADYQVHPKIRLRSRVDIIRSMTATGKKGCGLLIFQDIRFLPCSRLQVDARATLFDTDGYNSRVFQFENDLLYVLSNAMLFDQGQRIYILLKIEASSWLDIWFKAATTVYQNRTTVERGVHRIDGNRRSDIGVQARVRF